jgi:hypothetical protein
MTRLSLVTGQPFPTQDVAPTGALFDTDIGTPGLSLSLAGLPALSLFDVFNAGGTLITNPMPQMSDLPITGVTAIGGMIGASGIASVFDGNTNKPDVNGARSGSLAVGFALANSVGFALASAMPVTRVLVTSPNNSGFVGSGSEAPWQLLGSATNNFATATLLAIGYLPASNASGPTQVDIRLTNGLSSLGYYWFCIYGNATNNNWIAQVQPFTELPMSSRGIITVGGNPVNAAAIGSVAPQSAIYRGTILISETAGLMRQTLSYGLNRMFPIWNMTDRRRIEMVAGFLGEPDSSGKYRYTPAPRLFDAYGPAMGNPNICATIVNGMADSTAQFRYIQAAYQNGGSAPTSYTNAIGIAGSNCPFGTLGSQNFDTTGTDQGAEVCAHYTMPPTFGAVKANALETAVGNVTGFYNEPNMKLIADFEC